YRLDKINSIKSLERIGVTGISIVIEVLENEDSDVRMSAAAALGKICTVKHKKQLEDLLKSDNEFSVNTAFEILYDIEKEERSKVVLFNDEKFLKT
ncbi:MAG: HEAT repeat domain-containing protein, partial [Methanosarcina thermophila]